MIQPELIVPTNVNSNDYWKYFWDFCSKNKEIIAVVVIILGLFGKNQNNRTRLGKFYASIISFINTGDITFTDHSHYSTGNGLGSAPVDFSDNPNEQKKRDEDFQKRGSQQDYVKELMDKRGYKGD